MNLGSGGYTWEGKDFTILLAHWTVEDAYEKRFSVQLSMQKAVSVLTGNRQ